VLDNPLRYIDPSGLAALSGEEKEHLLKLQQDYLESAGRHNRLAPQMDDNGYAALIAATILEENIVDPLSGSDTTQFWLERNAIGLGGCIVSGHYLKQACKEELDMEQCLAYLANELPKGHPLWILASVGIGNIKLYTAANLWRGRACRVAWDDRTAQYVEECVPTQANPLQQTKRFLWITRDVDLPNPFAEDCDNGVCETYDPVKTTASYQELARQLLDDRNNIEYAAAILEQGSLRAMTIPDLTPSAFNSVTWYQRGVQTNDEIERHWGSGGQGGSAIFVLNNVPKILNVWRLNTVWRVGRKNEPQYYHWCEQLGWQCE
jgi:hypothetical protein